MSAKLKPSFVVDGKTYEFVFNRDMQVEYQKRTEEKRNDSQYQKEMAEFTRLQEEYETLQKRYSTAREAWLDNPLDEDKKAVYLALKEAYEEAFAKFTDYASTHTAPNEADQFVLKMIGDLTLLALQEQYELSAEKALEVWNKFVEETGDNGAKEWLAYAGKIWLVADEEDSENPFIQKMREKAIQQADNRKTGLNKVKK